MLNITLVTGIVVVHNTQALFKRAYESVRRFHPKMQLIIIDGSDRADACFDYVASLKGGANMVYQLGRNIGHGRGMHFALERCCEQDNKYPRLFLLLYCPCSQR
jgi:hypothetical protein